MRQETALEIVKNLKHKQFARKVGAADEFDGLEIDECVICLEAFTDGQQVVEIPMCHHLFHPDCLEKWFQSQIQATERRCPLCNIEVSLPALLNHEQ
jgi:hypothetical protein